MAAARVGSPRAKLSAQTGTDDGSPGEVEPMSRTEKVGQQRLHRIQLVARVQVAYDQLRDAVTSASKGLPGARRAVLLARRRLSMLNRALAMVALESAAA
jgi:hypothetical protein